MNSIHLRSNCVHLASDGAMRPSSMGSIDGRMLALYHVSGPDDVHYPAWEMHPEGDELLIVATGSLSVEFRDDAMERAPLSPETAVIVPAGIWHRLVVHEPSVLIAITPRHNTVHERGN